MIELNLANKPTILQQIVLDKIEWVKQKQATFPLEQFQQKITKSDRTFYEALAQGTHQRPVFILECKKASPSKGLIRQEFNLTEIANVYRHYAGAISILLVNLKKQGMLKRGE